MPNAPSNRVRYTSHQTPKLIPNRRPYYFHVHVNRQTHPQQLSLSPKQKSYRSLCVYDLICVHNPNPNPM